MTPTEIVALIGGGSVIGTVVVAVVTSWLKKGEKNLDEAGEIRKELRDQNKAQQQRIDDLMNRLDMQMGILNTLEKELNVWQAKYYTLERNYNVLMAERDGLAQKTVTMQGEIDALTAKVNGLEKVKISNKKA
jgi:chromosome segregation ATPase